MTPHRTVKAIPTRAVLLATSKTKISSQMMTPAAPVKIHNVAMQRVVLVKTSRVRQFELKEITKSVLLGILAVDSPLPPTEAANVGA